MSEKLPIKKRDMYIECEEQESRTKLMETVPPKIKTKV